MLNTLVLTMVIPLMSISGMDESDKTDWRVLFDSTHFELNAWTHVGAGEFVLVDGTLMTDCSPEGLGLLLYTKEKFGNCQIKVVYRSEDRSDNAGVYVRIADDLEKLQAPSDPDEETGPWFAVHNGYEVQICDAADPLHRTGAIYSLAEAKQESQKSPEDWKTMIITLDGDLVYVEIDGNRVTEFDPKAEDLPPRTQWYEPKRDAERPQTGYIGLQNHDPGDVVYFKEVSVRPLSQG